MPIYAPYMSEEQKQLFAQAVKDGVFVRHNFRQTNIKRSFTLPLTNLLDENDPLCKSLQKKTALGVRLSKKRKLPYELRECRSILRNLFKKLTYSMPLSGFVPPKLVEEFVVSAEETRERLLNIRPNLLASIPKYGDIVKKEFEEIAVLLWRYDLNNDGDPPKRFVSSVVEELFEQSFSEDAIMSVCDFRLCIFSLPNAGGTVPESICNLQHKRYTDELFDRVIRKRQKIALWLTSRIPNLGNGSLDTYPTLIEFLQENLKLVFYEDDEFKRLLNEFIDYLILSLRRDVNMTAERMIGIISYLTSNTDYPLFMTWENGKIQKHPCF